MTGGMEVAVGALMAGTYGLRLSGVLIATRIKQLAERGSRVLDAAVVALLVAVIVESGVVNRQGFIGVDRTVGLAVGAICIARRTPLIVALIAGAGTSAVIHLILRH